VGDGHVPLVACGGVCVQRPIEAAEADSGNDGFGSTRLPGRGVQQRGSRHGRNRMAWRTQGAAAPERKGIHRCPVAAATGLEGVCRHGCGCSSSSRTPATAGRRGRTHRQTEPVTRRQRTMGLPPTAAPRKRRPHHCRRPKLAPTIRCCASAPDAAVRAHTARWDAAQDGRAWAAPVDHASEAARPQARVSRVQQRSGADAERRPPECAPQPEAGTPLGSGSAPLRRAHARRMLALASSAPASASRPRHPTPPQEKRADPIRSRHRSNCNPSQQRRRPPQ
jgi:hypothetical protein